MAEKIINPRYVLCKTYQPFESLQMSLALSSHEMRRPIVWSCNCSRVYLTHHRHSFVSLLWMQIGHQWPGVNRFFLPIPRSEWWRDRNNIGEQTHAHVFFCKKISLQTVCVFLYMYYVALCPRQTNNGKRNQPTAGFEGRALIHIWLRLPVQPTQKQLLPWQYI